MTAANARPRRVHKARDRLLLRWHRWLGLGALVFAAQAINVPVWPGISELARNMIIRSSNLATNLLLDLLGIGFLQRVLEELEKELPSNVSQAKFKKVMEAIEHEYNLGDLLRRPDVSYAGLMSLDNGRYATADVSRETLGSLSESVIDTPTRRLPMNVAIPLIEGDGPVADSVRFRMYSNYAAFIERAEVRELCGRFPLYEELARV